MRRRTASGSATTDEEERADEKVDGEWLDNDRRGDEAGRERTCSPSSESRCDDERGLSLLTPGSSS